MDKKYKMTNSQPGLIPTKTSMVRELRNTANCFICGHIFNEPCLWDIGVHGVKRRLSNTVLVTNDHIICLITTTVYLSVAQAYIYFHKRINMIIFIFPQILVITYHLTSHYHHNFDVHCLKRSMTV